MLSRVPAPFPAVAAPGCGPGLAGGTGGTGGAWPGSSVQARAASMSRSYCTPDGHAVMHAMQPRQRSKCSAAAGLSSAPSRTCVTRWIRPRGESISSPQSA